MDGAKGKGTTTLGELKELILGVDSKVDNIKSATNRIIDVTNIHMKKIAKLVESNNELKRDVKALIKESEYSRKNQREKNIVLHNVEDKNEINDNLFKYVMDIIKLTGVQEGRIEYIRRIGKIENIGKRPVLIKLLLARDKKLFFDKLSELKDNYSILVTNDYSKEERERYKELKNIKNQLMEKGTEAKIIKGKLMIGDRKIEVSQALKMLKEEQKDHEDTSENDRDRESEVESVNSVATNSTRKREASISPYGSRTSVKQRKHILSNINRKMSVEERELIPRIKSVGGEEGL